MKDKNLISDIQRGTARLADGASLLGEGTDSSNFAHQDRVTPMRTKAGQIAAAEELGINPTREKSTSRKRGKKEVKPI